MSDKIKDTVSSWDRTNQSFEDTTKTLRKEIDKIKDEIGDGSSGEGNLGQAIDTIIDEKKRIQEVKDNIETDYNLLKEQKEDVDVKKQTLDTQ